jgi:hypothetical protein
MKEYQVKNKKAEFKLEFMSSFKDMRNLGSTNLTKIGDENEN